MWGNVLSTMGFEMCRREVFSGWLLRLANSIPDVGGPKMSMLGMEMHMHVCPRDTLLITILHGGFNWSLPVGWNIVLFLFAFEALNFLSILF